MARASLLGTHASRDELRFGRTSAAEKHKSDAAQWESSVSYPAFCTVTASGPIRRPAARRRSASLSAPLRGLGSSQNKFVSARQRVPHKLLPGPTRKSTPWHLGAGPTSLVSDPSKIGKFNKTEITTIHQNKVTLIGFLGNDAEVRANDDRSFTTLSLATKSSYKEDGQYISHTEWHRCVVFGELSEFAGTLKKGAHLQVEGELRSREYETKKVGKKPAQKKTIWEVRVNSILKLDRAEKAGLEEGGEATD